MKFETKAEIFDVLMKLDKGEGVDPVDALMLILQIIEKDDGG